MAHTLTRFPGVYRRADSGTFQFGLRVPTDLRKHFDSDWAVRCSLGTTDLSKANDKAKGLHAEWAAKFETLRRGSMTAAELAALRAALLDRVEARLHELDARAATLSEKERGRLVAAAQDFLAEGRDALADARVPDWLEDWIARVVPVRLPVAVAEATAAYLLLLELQIEAFTDSTRTFPLRVQRLAARRALIAASPTATAEVAGMGPRPSGRTGKRIADALAVWKETPRLSKTVGTFQRHVDFFEQSLGDPVLASVDRPMAVQFRDAVQTWAIEECKTQATAENVLVSVRALFNVARDQGWIAGNLFERLPVKVGGKESEGREPWTHDELRALFDDPVWTAYTLPAARKAGAAAAYWIPLMACYTGARVSEIAQLWTDDLSLGVGAEVIEFRATTDRGQRLKNEGSWRAVPMHSELIRLGLCEYAASLPARSPLFPTLPTAGENGAGGQFSQWFGAFKKGKGFKSPAKSLHSFRHLVATELRLAGASDALADAVTGHAGTGIGRTTYAATIRREAERLRPTIELLRYGLELPRVYGGA